MVNHANEVLNQNKEVEKMVKQVIGSGENISQEGRTVLASYMSSVRELNHLFGEKLEDTVIINGKETRELRDTDNRMKRMSCSQESDSDSCTSSSFECPKCGRSCSSSHNLSQHTKACKGVPKPHRKKYTCKYCKKYVNSQFNLTNHIKHVHNKGETEEDRSEKPLGSSTKSHNADQTEKEKKKEKQKNVKEGEKNTTESPSSTPAKSKHTKVNKKQNKSTREDKQNDKGEKASKNDADKMENGKIIFSCNYCGKSCESQNKYVEHKKKCVAPLFVPEKTVPCDLCTEKFFNLGALNKHKEHCHN